MTNVTLINVMSCDTIGAERDQSTMIWEEVEKVRPTLSPAHSQAVAGVRMHFYLGQVYCATTAKMKYIYLREKNKVREELAYSMNWISV